MPRAKGNQSGSSKTFRLMECLYLEPILSGPIRLGWLVRLGAADRVGAPGIRRAFAGYAPARAKRSQLHSPAQVITILNSY